MIAGALLAFILFLPEPEIFPYRDIIVKEIQGEPVVERTFVDRIVYRDRQPDLVATEPEGGTDVVEDFCHPDTVLRVVKGDTVWVQADTVYLLRSVVHDPGWFFQRDRVRIYGPTSTGDLREMRFRTYPGWSVRTDPELIFREPRLGWMREAVEALAFLWLGRVSAEVF
jgi:hypothetical protein